VGENVSPTGKSQSIPTVALRDASTGGMFGGASCGCAACNELGEVSLPQVTQKDNGDRLTFSLPCLELSFIRQEGSSSTADTWILDEENLDHTKVPNTDGISITVTNDEITLNLEGQAWKFHGFGQEDDPKGEFKSSPDLETTYTTNGDLDTLKRPAGYSGDGPDEEYVYDYLASGPNSGLLASVTLKRDVPGSVAPRTFPVARPKQLRALAATQ